jgi:hypothetical protein
MALPQPGVISVDVPTALRAVIQANCAAFFNTGVYPVHSLSNNPDGSPIVWTQPGSGVSPYAQVVNKPILCTIAADFTTQLGESDDWISFPPMQVYQAGFIDAFPQPVSPQIHNNVWDPWLAKNHTQVSALNAPLVNGLVTIDAEVILPSLVVKGTAGRVYVNGTDFQFAYDDNTLKSATLTVFAASPMFAETSVSLTYCTPIVSGITEDDIAGGTDVNGNNLGLEVIEDVYQHTDITAAIVFCPGWTSNDVVYAAGNARVQSINNGRFRAIYLYSVDPEAVQFYNGILEWKNSQNMVSAFSIGSWPHGGLGTPGPYGKYVYEAATIEAVTLASTDASYGLVPYVSPDNKGLAIDRTYVGTFGTPSFKQVRVNWTWADQIEEWGVSTFVNDNGWKSYGGLTPYYPGGSDPIFMWINVRRYFCWFGSTMSLTLQQFKGLPGNQRSLSAIQATISQFGNAQVQIQALNSFHCYFLPEENPAENVINGEYTYHIDMVVPIEIRTIQLMLQFSIPDLTAWISQVSQTINAGTGT